MNDVLLADLVQQLQTEFDAGDYARGFALGRHILRFYPRHLATYKLMGRASLDAGLSHDGIDLLQRALSADPEDGDLWAALHLAALDQNLPAETALAETYARALLTPELIDDNIARGHIAAREQDWPAAYRAYRQGYLAHPQRMDAALGLLNALYHQQACARAHTLARHILNELPHSLKALWMLLLCHPGEDETPHAPKHHLNTARSLDPDDVFIVQWLGHPLQTYTSPPAATLPPWDETKRWQYSVPLNH